MSRGLLNWLGLAAAMALLCAAAARPVIPRPVQQAAPQYTIAGGGLIILNHPDYREFQYVDGVEFQGAGLQLRAGELRIEVSYGDLAGRESIKLPTPQPEALERDPSGAAAELAREVYLPSPELTPDMLKLIRAGGGVVIETAGIRLTAPGIESTDGGATWRATGRSQIAASNLQAGGQVELTADALTYDTANQTGQARGHITAEFSNPGQPTVSLNAAELSFDVAHQRLVASDGLQATSGEVKLCCGELDADLSARTLSATGHPQVSYATRQLLIAANELHYQLDKQILCAKGEVSASDGESGASLTAGQVEYDIQAEVAVAAGQPRLAQGLSYYTGEILRVTRQADGKLIVEVEGKQSGKLDMSALPGLFPPPVS